MMLVRSLTERFSALTAELDPGAFAKLQLEHLSFSDAPHSPQNFMPLAFSKPQAAQRIEGACRR